MTEATKEACAIQELLQQHIPFNPRQKIQWLHQHLCGRREPLYSCKAAMGVASRETPHSLKAHFEYSDTCAMVTKGKGMANRHDRRRSGRWKGRQGLWYRRDAGYSSQSAAAEALHGRMLRQQSLQQRLHRWMLLTLMAVCVSLPVGAASPFTRVFVPLCKPINEPPPMGTEHTSAYHAPLHVPGAVRKRILCLLPYVRRLSQGPGVSLDQCRCLCRRHNPGTAAEAWE